MYCQTDALRLLTEHGTQDAFLEKVVAESASANLREMAFRSLVERRHRPTIERSLSELIENEQSLRAGETDLPFDGVAVGTSVDPMPPAQIRTCRITACGSYLGCLAPKR
jgi:hypothetical protein